MTITDIPRTEHGGDHAAVHAGLIAAAAFIALHPGLPLGDEGDRLHVSVQDGSDEENRDQVDRIAAILGVPAGYLHGSRCYYGAVRDFGGGVTYKAVAISAEEMTARNSAMGRHSAAGDARSAA